MAPAPKPSPRLASVLGGSNSPDDGSDSAAEAANHNAAQYSILVAPIGSSRGCVGWCASREARRDGAPSVEPRRSRRFTRPFSAALLRAHASTWCAWVRTTPLHSFSARGRRHWGSHCASKRDCAVTALSPILQAARLFKHVFLHLDMDVGSGPIYPTLSSGHAAAAPRRASPRRSGSARARRRTQLGRPGPPAPPAPRMPCAHGDHA